jgi:AraC-like DNA-binding protein
VGGRGAGLDIDIEIGFHFHYSREDGNGPIPASLGLSSRPGMTRTPFTRTSLRRLRRAVRERDPAAVLDAGALAAAVAEGQPHGAAAASRAGAILEALLIDPEECLPAALRGRVEGALEDVLQLAAAPDANEGVGRALRCLWQDVASALAPSVEPPSSASLAQAVQDYLADHLDERVTLAGLARALGYSPSHVSSVVRRLTGQRFTALRTTIRLERALWLLGRGATVKAAGLGAGFSDAAYFSRVFRRVYGVPPSRWREASLRRTG